MRLHHLVRCLPVVLLAAAGVAHSAQGDGARSSTYQQDRAACAQISSPESKAACIHEAGAAQQAARTGQLTSVQPGNYENNALQRCSTFTDAADKAACVDRVRGGATEGSVSGGGVLRETVTTVPASPR
ncbi:MULTISPECIES: hypothetical protein [unclassified Acidovorax]|uniref:hypothetical protein n=1 Tax=unclassified Acidovorax TaxID=2684926 RepID=UPI002883268C|nr:MULTISPECIES: hypothetical protein [unclassified Acidovorax]